MPSAWREEVRRTCVRRLIARVTARLVFAIPFTKLPTFRETENPCAKCVHKASKAKCVGGYANLRGAAPIQVTHVMCALAGTCDHQLPQHLHLSVDSGP